MLKEYIVYYYGPIASLVSGYTSFTSKVSFVVWVSLVSIEFYALGYAGVEETGVVDSAMLTLDRAHPGPRVVVLPLGVHLFASMK